MLVVAALVRMPLQGPEDIAFKSMRVTVVSNHLRVVVEDCQKVRKMT